jgi:DNA polymerase-3 subunit epsilon
MVTVAEGIHSRQIAETPFAVLDFETTGLTPGLDRVVEVSIVRMNPGEEPRLALDTLVNPMRNVACTEIHGITDADVADAPRFGEIAGDIIDALTGCVVSAYNVYFDMRFLDHELSLSGLRHEPPHLCLMYLRPLLQLGRRCKLPDACEAHGIRLDDRHAAAADTMAAARLLHMYLNVLRDRGVRTFGELAEHGSYKFLASLRNAPFAAASQFELRPSGRRKSRVALVMAPSPQKIDGLREYWEALKLAVTDLEITEDELASMQEIRARHSLKIEHIRVIHARAFAGVIGQYVADQWLDERERGRLMAFHRCLSALGWAPGE